jgi:dihydrofolate reductase
MQDSPRGPIEEEVMRTVVVSNIVSLDGFYEGPGGDVMALNMDAAFDAYNLERIRAAGTVLLGRRSFDGFSAYWPKVATAPHDPTDRALSDDNRDLSRLYDSLPKVVVSDELAVPADNPWHAVTSVVPRADAASRVTAEKHRGAGDILIFGSRTMWNGLLAQGLVDEIHLMVGPRALAGGTPTFDGPADLRLLDVRRPEESDNVLVRYAVRR